MSLFLKSLVNRGLVFIFAFEILSLLVPLFKIAFFFLVVGEKGQNTTLGGTRK